MRYIRFAWCLGLLLVAGTADGQSKPVRTARSFLVTPFDLSQTSLSPDFHGHDITAVFKAIKNSPALQEKSEFESTSAYQTRVAGFTQEVLYGSVTPNGYFGFIVFAPEIKYDADSQTLAVTLRGFAYSSDPKLDEVLIQDIDRKDSYIGSNAFGAQVEVESTYSENYGVLFNQGNWLFGGTKPADPLNGRHFTYLMPMAPDEAKAFKANVRLLLVCRLSPPWYRQTSVRNAPTLDFPHDYHVEQNYLQAEPEQLWIFDQQTGEVIRKLPESTLEKAAKAERDKPPSDAKGVPNAPDVNNLRTLKER